MKLSVRESEERDFEKIVDYFLNSEPDFLRGMGADIRKLPARDKWIENLKIELARPYDKKGYFYVIWQIDEQAVGHSNINHIVYGESATMHLHVWQNVRRKSGLGLAFLKMTIPIFFEKLALKKLICEPFSGNPAPNKTLKKFGFDFIKNYETIPGPINLPQIVSRYELTKEQLEKITRK